MSYQNENRGRPASISAEAFKALCAGRRAALTSTEGAVLPRRWNAPRSGEGESQLPLRITLPFLPPSVNKLFTTVAGKAGGARRVLTSHARRIRKLILAMVRGRLKPERLYEMRADVFLNAFTNSGGIRKVDLSNRIKFLEDCICQALGIDDRQIFRLVMNKYHADAEYTVVTISRFRPEEPDLDSRSQS